MDLNIRWTIPNNTWELTFPNTTKLVGLIFGAKYSYGVDNPSATFVWEVAIATGSANYNLGVFPPIFCLNVKGSLAQTNSSYGSLSQGSSPYNWETSGIQLKNFVGTSSILTTINIKSGSTLFDSTPFPFGIMSVSLTGFFPLDVISQISRCLISQVSVSEIRPTTGSTSGGEEVFIYGTNFPNNCDIVANFGSVSTNNCAYNSSSAGTTMLSRGCDSS